MPYVLYSNLDMMTSKIKLLLLLVSIILVSFLLRFYQLGLVPNGITVDEADVGYNAFLILKTGKDVYDRSYPLFFQSFDVYQPSFQIYASIPAIYLFGLNDISIRIIPAFIGVLSTILFYFIAKLLFPKQTKLTVLAFLLITLSPWNIAISRGNLVTVEVIFLYFLFFVLFLYGIYKNAKVLPFSFIFLGLTIYAYHIAIIYLPLLLILLAIIYKKELVKHWSLALLSITVVFVVTIPAILFYQNPITHNRFDTVTSLTPDITLPTSIAEMENDNNSLISKILHNRRLVYANVLFDTYFDYFNLDYLFINSKNIRYFYVNYVGIFYFIELPFVIYGLKILLQRRQQVDQLLLGLLLIGPIPAAFALGSPFVHRAPILLFAIQMISAVGIAGILKDIGSKKINYGSYYLLVIYLIYSIGVLHFTHQYFVHSPREFTSELDNSAWFSSVKNVIPIINANENKYDKVVFTWSKTKLVPAVYFLFYNQIDPKILQAKARKWTNEPPSYKQIYNQIGNIEFRPINWETDQFLKNTLFVGYPSEFPNDINSVIARTFTPNGQSHFLIVKSN